MPVNILPVEKEIYYRYNKVISKEKQDGTILASKLIDLKMTFNVITETFIKFYL